MRSSFADCPMALIVLEKVEKSFGGRPVIREASLEIREGEKIGLVGRNGSGKTTLLNLMGGKLDPDKGEARMKKNLSIGFLHQDPKLNPRNTLFETARGCFEELARIETQLREMEDALARGKGGTSPEGKLLQRHGELQEKYRMMGGYSFRNRVEKVLNGLGFTRETWHKRVEALSGGEKNRLCLACLLLTDPEILLLDEPTHYLDIPTSDWLEGFLLEYRGAAVIISHDRYFLNRVAQKIIEIENGEVRTYRGNYDASVLQKEDREKKRKKERLLLEEEIRRQEEFIRRNIYGQKSRQAQSRKKVVERLKEELKKAPPAQEDEVAMGFTPEVETGEEVLIIEGLSKRFGDRVLFEDLDLKVTRGERVGIIGPNGCGKSTLFRMILGTEPPAAGSCRFGYRVNVGYYDQEQGNLTLCNPVKEEVHSSNRKATEEEVRKVLGRFLFSGEDLERRVEDLSGGERGRVLLAKLILGRHNLLLLDEPTNHLDISSRQILERALQEFPGTVLIISHDRFLLDRLVTRLLVFSGTRLHIHAGNYATYRDRFLKFTGVVKEERESGEKKERKKKRPFRGKTGEKRIDPYKLEKLEGAIIEREERIADVEKALGLEENYKSASKVKGLTRELMLLRKELNNLNRQWEEYVG